MDKEHELLKLDYDLWKSFLVMLFIISFSFGIALVVYPAMKSSNVILIAIILIIFLIFFGYMFFSSVSNLMNYLGEK